MSDYIQNGITWNARGSSLAIYHTTNPPKAVKREHDEATVFLIETGSHIYSETNRKLVNDFHTTFLNVQGIVSETSNNNISSLLLECSQEYRTKIQVNMKRLTVLVDQSADVEKYQYENEYALLCNAHLVWHLCEIMLMDLPMPGNVVQKLLGWITPHLKTTYLHVQRALGTSGNHPEYWEAVYRLVLIGDIMAAQSLLVEHYAKASKPFQIVLDLLKNMPQQKLQNLSFNELSLKWQYWKKQCTMVMAQGIISSVPQLEIICRILAGDAEVFVEVKDLFENWWHLLVSKLLFSDPMIEPNNVIQHAKEAQVIVGQELNNVDNILVSILECRYHKILEDMSHHLPWWFSAHLGDLLHHYTSGEFKYSNELREFLIVNYAAGLLSHKSLWELGADYLDLCPVKGKPMLECLLERVPVDSEYKGRKVYRLCKKLNLTSLANSVCKTMARNGLNKGKLGTALVWAIWSDDANLVSHLCEKYLFEYLNTGTFMDLDLIDHLDSSHLTTDTLIFLGRFRKFHQMYEDKEFVDAAAELVALFEVCPTKYRKLLLLDAMPLLKDAGGDVIFNIDQTQFLIDKLTEHELEEQLGMVNESVNRINDERDVVKERMDKLVSKLVQNVQGCIESGPSKNKI